MADAKSLLQLARDRRDLKQEAVAKRLKVTQATVSNWEARICSPHPSMWKKISSVYGVPLSELFEYFGEKRASS